jgi:hypothetical protein
MELQSRPFDLEGENAFIESPLLCDSHKLMRMNDVLLPYEEGGLSKGMMFRRRPTSLSHASMLSFVKHLQSKSSFFLRVVGPLQH